MKYNRRYIIIADKNFLGCDLFIKNNIGATAIIASEDYIQGNDIQELNIMGAIKILPLTLDEDETIGNDTQIPDPIVSSKPKGRPGKPKKER